LLATLVSVFANAGFAIGVRARALTF
jgi:hypothetical protein